MSLRTGHIIVSASALRDHHRGQHALRVVLVALRQRGAALHDQEEVPADRAPTLSRLENLCDTVTNLLKTSTCLKLINLAETFNTKHMFLIVIEVITL